MDNNMTCALKIDTKSAGWEVTMTKMMNKIKGVSYEIDAEEGIAYVSGRVNPNTLLKKLMKAGKHAELCWVRAGSSDLDPYSTSHGYHHVYGGGYARSGPPYQGLAGYYPYQNHNPMSTYKYYPPPHHYHLSNPYINP